MPDTSIPCEQIDRKHDSWKRLYTFWEALRKLSEDDDIIMYNHAAQFLPKRSKEPDEIYAERCRKFNYPNHLKNIKGWYSSALFKQPATIVLRKPGVSGPEAVIQDSPQAKQVADFMDDVTGSGVNLGDFWKEQVQPKLLTYRQAFILFDVPAAGEFRNLAEQKTANALRPHLVSYDPQDVINWQVDERGLLLWAIVKVRAVTQDSWLDEKVVADRWYIYDRKQVWCYEYIIPKDQMQRNWSGIAGDPIGLGGELLATSQYGAKASANLLPGYPRSHALADQNMVPLFWQKLQRDLWIGQRIASPLIKLLDIENSYDYGLVQNNLAMLTIFRDKAIDNVHVSEMAFIQLGKEDRAEYLEQSGRAYEASRLRVNELREEIYRLAYLVAQGRSSSATAAMQSGYSKEQDMMPARDILSAMGDQVRNSFQAVLRAAVKRMGLDIDVDVQGFDFLDRGDVSQIEVIERGDTVAEINSETYRKERNKALVGRILPDLNRETKQIIQDEIDNTDTPEKVAADAAKTAQTQFNNPAIGGGTGKGSGTPDQALAQRLQTATKLNSPTAFRDADNAA